MKAYGYITLRQLPPQIKDSAAQWFHSKWHVPKEAYLACMGVIENDFHERKDLSPCHNNHIKVNEWKAAC